MNSYNRKKLEPAYADGLKADKNFIWTIKKDWYGQDHLYLRSNKNSVFFTLFAGIDCFENRYFDFFPDDAFIRQIKYITDFYTTKTDTPDREYPYLSKAEMDAFVDETIKVLESIR